MPIETNWNDSARGNPPEQTKEAMEKELAYLESLKPEELENQPAPDKQKRAERIAELKAKIAAL